MNIFKNRWTVVVLLVAGAALARRAPAQGNVTALGAEEFAAALKEPKACLVDMRPGAQFGAGHIAGFTNIGLRAGVSDWLKKMLPADCRPVVVFGDDKEAEQAAGEFAKAGITAPLRYLRGGMASWKGTTTKLPQKSVAELKQALGAGENLIVLDVRSNEEWQGGHIRGARHFVLNDLVKTSPELPKDRPVAVICASGYRSSIAASLLQARGYTVHGNVTGGMNAWQGAGYETVQDK